MWRKILKTGGRNFAPFFILLWPIYLLGDVSTSTILHIFGSHLVEILLFILVWTDEISYWNEFLFLSLRMFFKNGAKSDSKFFKCCSLNVSVFSEHWGQEPETPVLDTFAQWGGKLQILYIGQYLKVISKWHLQMLRTGVSFLRLW